MRLIWLGGAQNQKLIITLAKQRFGVSSLGRCAHERQAMQYFIVSFLGQVMKEFSRLFRVAKA